MEAEMVKRREQVLKQREAEENRLAEEERQRREQEEAEERARAGECHRNTSKVWVSGLILFSRTRSRDRTTPRRGGCCQRRKGGKGPSRKGGEGEGSQRAGRGTCPHCRRSQAQAAERGGSPGSPERCSTSTCTRQRQRLASSNRIGRCWTVSFTVTSSSLARPAFLAYCVSATWRSRSRNSNQSVTTRQLASQPSRTRTTAHSISTSCWRFMAREDGQQRSCSCRQPYSQRQGQPSTPCPIKTCRRRGRWTRSLEAQASSRQDVIFPLLISLRSPFSIIYVLRVLCATPPTCS